MRPWQEPRNTALGATLQHALPQGSNAPMHCRASRVNNHMNTLAVVLPPFKHLAAFPMLWIL